MAIVESKSERIEVQTTPPARQEERRDAGAPPAFYGVHRPLPDAPLASFFGTAVLPRNHLRAARAKGGPPHGR